MHVFCRVVLAAVKAYIDMLGIWAALIMRSCQTLCWTHNLNAQSLYPPQARRAVCPGEGSPRTAGAGGLALP